MSDLSIPMPNYTNITPKEKSPVEMLREAAETLKQHTGGFVEGSVFTSNPGDSNLFRHTFYLRTRALNDYTYPLFYVWHDRELYPASLLMAGEDQSKVTICNDVTELRDKLVEIFASSGTVQLIGALIKQATI